MAISCLLRAGAAVILLPTGAAAAPDESQPAPVAPQPWSGDCAGDQDGEDGKATWCGSTTYAGGIRVFRAGGVRALLLTAILGSNLSSSPGRRLVSNFASTLLIRRPFVTARNAFVSETFLAQYFEELVLRGHITHTPNMSFRASRSISLCSEFRCGCS